MSDPGRGDPFGKVLGQSRGLRDPAALGIALQHAKDALDVAVAELRASHQRESELRDDIIKLAEDLDEANLQSQRALQLAQQAEGREYELRDARDRARYAAMRSGMRDPPPNLPSEHHHHGVWTPGRPYLSYQHVWHPRTGACYRTDKGGAAPGELPGTARHGEVCMTKTDLCPIPKPVPVELLDHPLDGEALRQTEFWWDRNHTAWNVRDPREVPDDYLENIVAYLRSGAQKLWTREALWNVPFVPCPWNAYPSPTAWLADTPLMRELLRGRKRRAAARRRACRPSN